MKVLALYSNKGGVGKTTTAVNLAYLAAQGGMRTLLVDLDAQGSATFYFRVRPKLKRKARGLSEANKAVAESVRATEYERLDVLPADPSNRSLDTVYEKQKHRYRRLKEMLGGFEPEYDLIVLDCPPTLSVLGENILVAAHHVLVPLIPTTLSLRAHEMLVAFQAAYDYPQDTTHIFFSMVDRRRKVHQEMMAQVWAKFPSVFDATVPASAQIEQMGLHRQPLGVYAPRSASARAFRDLWAEARARLHYG